jgi:opacity protein-like surface antigen
LVGLCVCLIAANQAHSQPSSDRAHTWEAGFHVVDMSDATLDGIFGSSLDVDNQIGYGFTGAYNFTNRFALMLDVNWSRPNYRATFVPEGGGNPVTISTKLDVATILAKGVFYLTDGDVAPFVEVGAGWTTLDSNIADGPPITGCWWDPWWGYVCRNYYDTYTETKASYSAGFGVRWDFSDELMMRGSVGALKVDTPRDTENATIDTIQVDFAWRF